MPIPILQAAFQKGSSSLQYVIPVLKVAPWIVLIALLKFFFGGMRNRSERLMHGKVVIMTGGTSGIGAVVARNLAARGAQLVLLTQQAPTDPFLADFIDDMRAESGNELIYAEQVDLASLHSVRSFATRWIDNTPPRRLDLILLCAATLTPRFAAHADRAQTLDGAEPCWGVNCLAPAHLLSILSPAIRAQPADREVRIVVAACGRAAARAGDLRRLKDSASPLPAGSEFDTAALARIILARQFQRQLDAAVRGDKQPSNARVILVDPGLSRTPGMRRWLSGGSLWGLLLYLVAWPVVWLVLKSADQGSQSFLFACMEAALGTGVGGKFIRECREVVTPREAEVGDARVGEELWAFVERQIKALEKQGAVRRALQKKEAEAREGKSQGKVIGEVQEDGDATVSSTANGERKPGSRRSRKAA